jgi:hypothetical protein
MKKQRFKVLAPTTALSMVALSMVALAPAAADGSEGNDANRRARLTTSRARTSPKAPSPGRIPASATTR